MSGPYFHSEDWVGKLTPTPITWVGGATASRLEDTGASTTEESSVPASLASSRACHKALLSSSPSISSPTYSPNSGPGGTPTPPGTPPTFVPDSSPGPTLGSPPPLPMGSTRGSPPGNPPDSPPTCPLAPPTDQPLASPPEHPPAPIECNDPILACVQMVRHSLDRLSGDREAMMKTIEPLSFNIRRLEKKCEEILVKIRSRDHNDYARAINSGVRDHSTSLEPLYDLENKIPLSFPRMVGDIKKLNTAGVNTLLTLYGIPIQGTIAMKKRRLALFIGLISDIDV